MGEDGEQTDRRGSSPDISVVVPTRNRSALVARLLRQLAVLDPGPTYEVIVVDEASSDDTPALLERLAVEQGIRVVRHDEPRGLPAARNAGTAAARGRYLAWIDDDDLTSPDRLRRQHEELVAGGRRWSCAARVDIDDDLRVIGHVRSPATPLLPHLLRSNVLPSAGQGLLVEAALDAEVGGYDESLRSAEDWDYAIRLTAVAEPHLLDEPLVGYRTGTASMSTDTPRMEEAIATVVAKHAALYREAGVEPDWRAIHLSLLPADLLGTRRAAVGRAVKALRAGPSAQGLARVAAVAAVPDRVAARSRAQRRAQVPADWEARARRWLDRVPVQ
jgi:glycosyltransferase involved in cell wall biosynthesis